MRARVGTYNFSRIILKLKIFNSNENKFYNMHRYKTNYDLFSLHVKLSLCACLIIYIFKKLLH